jgi:hypothetical protein
LEPTFRWPPAWRSTGPRLNTEDASMSRRSSSRSIVGLILEIGFIALVVSLVPKLNLRPQAPADAAGPTLTQPVAAGSAAPWWQAAPSAQPTSWRAEESPAVNVEQTLQDASRQLLTSASDYAARAAHDLLAEPTPPPAAQPVEWRRY